jgi:Holliday junction resolvase
MTTCHFEGDHAMNSRAKGARGERELAKKLRELGYSARRGQQYSGISGDADVVGLPGIHIECKRVEAFQLYPALDQSRRDRREGELPVVMHRKNDHDWVVVMRLDDWIDVYKEWDAGKAFAIDKEKE